MKGNPVKYSDPTGHAYWIYYDDKLYSKQAAAEAMRQKGRWGDKNVKMRGVTDMRKDFVPSWNSEAAKDKDFMGSSWMFHGNKKAMFTRFSGIVTKIGMQSLKAIDIEQNTSKAKQYDLLSKLKMPMPSIWSPMIRLMTCNGGRLTKGENLAQAIAKRSYMSVWAMDGSLSYDIFRRPQLSGTDSLNNFFGIGSYSGINVFYKSGSKIYNYRER